jgi:hypothetical protein
MHKGKPHGEAAGIVETGDRQARRAHWVPRWIPGLSAPTAADDNPNADKHHRSAGKIPSRERYPINFVKPKQRDRQIHAAVRRIHAACRGGVQRQQSRRPGLAQP